MEKGKLSVQTENILPIIKKWLYSEKEIFIRELISNAFDALTKVKKVGLNEDIYQAEDQDYKIDITVDKEGGVLLIEDNGIGMNAEEVKKYITQIAFSGAEDFVKKYEDEKEGIIGNFGLGFYSAFMVSSRVEIESRSYRPDDQSVLWGSDGSEEYEIGEGSRENRGTTIRLFIDDEEKEEILNKTRIDELIRRFSDFIPVPINVDGEQANRQNPLWSKKPADLKKEEYTEFYQYMFPFQGDPLFHIHLNVDYPFNLQGILYFPRLAHELDLNKSNVKIYCKQIFITDEAQELVPKFLTVLQGVIDLPDLPLNVSRSYLQNEPQLKKIAGHIVKKVADRLTEEFKKNREEYSKIWGDIAPFVKYGMMNEDKFYEGVKDSVLFELSDEGEGAEKKYTTLEEYIVENKTKADGKIYYSSDPVAQAGPMKLLRDQGIQVLLLNTMIDSHFIQFIETKNADYKFTRIDSDLSETLVDKDASSEIVDSDNKKIDDQIIEVFKKAIGSEKVTIRVEPLKSDSIPAMILLNEQTRRFSEMTAHMTQNVAAFPEDHTLLVNAKNELVKKLARPGIIGGDGPSKNEKIARQIYSLARLTQGGVGPQDIEKFVTQSYELLEEMS